MTDNLSQKTKRKNDPTTKVLFSVIVILVIGIIGVSLFIVFDHFTTLEENNTASISIVNVDDEFDGSTTINPPRDMPDFTLTNQNNEPTSLSDLGGRYVLLTFGYTHCPDVCPLTLNEFRRIRESLGELASQVEFVFISVDPQRDTPSAIKQYFETRNLNGFIGLTGDEVDLRRIGVDYGLFFEIGEGTSQGGYLVDHTAGSYLLDSEGRWIMRYQFGAMPSMIVEDLQTFINS